MSENVRIGVIGVGIGRWHLESFSEAPGADVVAVCDADTARLAEARSRYKIPRAYRRIGELLGDRSVDAVSVCLPNPLHAETALAALEAGKHVLVEKPLARCASEGREIVNAARRTGLQAMVAMKFRFTPEAAHLVRHIEAGHIGAPFYGWNRYIRPVGKGIPGRWFCRRELSGGGTLIDNGVHLLDITWHLMGHPKPVEAFGACYAHFGPRGKGIGEEDALAFDVEDFAAGMIRFANGATILIENAWAAHVPETEIAAWVCGTEGSGSLWPLRIVEEQGGRSTDVTPSADSLERTESQFAHFVQAIRQGIPNASPVEQGLVVLRMLEALYESARTGKSVHLAADAAEESDPAQLEVGEATLFGPRPGVVENPS